MPFVKDDPNINRDGRPVGSRNFTTKVREALEKIADGKETTNEEALVKSIIKKAVMGDAPTQKLVWNYLDGMPKESLDIDNPKQRDEIERLREDIKLWMQSKEKNV
jgi:hypothetical protein